MLNFYCSVAFFTILKTECHPAEKAQVQGTTQEKSQSPPPTTTTTTTKEKHRTEQSLSKDGHLIWRGFRHQAQRIDSVCFTVPEGELADGKDSLCNLRGPVCPAMVPLLGLVTLPGHQIKTRPLGTLPPQVGASQCVEMKRLWPRTLGGYAEEEEEAGGLRV